MNRHNRYNRHQHHADRADRYVKEHGLERKESHKGIGARIKERLSENITHYQERNTPARRRERIENLKLESQEQQYKTAIYKSKSARKSGFGMMSSTPRRTSSRTVRARPASALQSHSFSGMNDLFGTGQNSARSAVRKQRPEQYQSFRGMDELF